jgi:hypothetical protein
MPLKIYGNPARISPGGLSRIAGRYVLGAVSVQDVLFGVRKIGEAISAPARGIGGNRTN